MERKVRAQAVVRGYEKRTEITGVRQFGGKAVRGHVTRSVGRGPGETVRLTMGGVATQGSCGHVTQQPTQQPTGSRQKYTEPWEDWLREPDVTDRSFSTNSKAVKLNHRPAVLFVDYIYEQQTDLRVKMEYM